MVLSVTRFRQSKLQPRTCPRTFRIPPSIRKVNPADTPILVLAATSDSLPLTVVDAYAQNILLEKISQISGVGLVGIGGEQQPTVRVQVDPDALAARGINLEDVRTVLGQANVDLPKGTLNSPRQTYTLNTNDQLFKPDQYADLIVAYRNGSPVRVRDIGRAISAGENELIAAWYNQGAGNPTVHPASARSQCHRDGEPDQGDDAGASGFNSASSHR